MVLLFLAYIGGILTILSPCILPVLPFVFARSDQPFRRNGLPLLAGMAITFVLVASLATVGGGWAVRAQSVRPHRSACSLRHLRPHAPLFLARRAAFAPIGATRQQALKRP